jgi:Domain of unknown function (DUF397)
VTESLRWRRSSHSQSGSDCVELAHTVDAVRDSKNPCASLAVPTLALVDAAKRWRRSSHSASGSECVELAHTLDAIRDSKNPGASLAVAARGLVEMAKRA